MSAWSLAGLVSRIRPKTIVELGAGDGAAAASILLVLPEHSTLTTINWPNPPSGDNPHRYLAKWIDDARLTLLFGDTRDPEVVARVPDSIDLLHIDSTHTRECADAEWRLYEPKLADFAVVVVDDLNHNDMMDFWNSLRGSKTTSENGVVGIMEYRRNAQ